MRCRPVLRVLAAKRAYTEGALRSIFTFSGVDDVSRIGSEVSRTSRSMTQFAGAMMLRMGS